MLSYFSHVWLFVTPCQAPLSMGFSRQEYWSVLSSPPGDVPDPGKQRKKGQCWGHLCKSVKGWITFSQGITKLTTDTCARARTHTHTHTHTHSTNPETLCWRLKSLPNFWPCVSYFTFHHEWFKTHMFLKKLGRITILSLLEFQSHSADFTVSYLLSGPQQVVLVFILWMVWVV